MTILPKSDSPPPYESEGSGEDENESHQEFFEGIDPQNFLRPPRASSIHNMPQPWVEGHAMELQNFSHDRISESPDPVFLSFPPVPAHSSVFISGSDSSSVVNSAHTVAEGAPAVCPEHYGEGQILQCAPPTVPRHVRPPAIEKPFDECFPAVPTNA